MKLRNIEEVLVARAASDGDGVRLKRVFGGGDLSRFDPFLMMDEFGSEEASDYIGGFPSHPHRGFETITYMLDGHMQHKDHMGNVGELKSGDVQWMTAGSGVIHSEMPQQKEGHMRGFQLWLNLAAKDKMQPAHYEDIAAATIPQFERQGAVIKAISGRVNDLQGRVQREVTEPVYLDIEITDERYFERFDVPDKYTVLVYVYEGEVEVGDQVLGQSHMARLSRDGAVQIKGLGAARMLLIAGKPIGEPIVSYGPFVMNTREEIEQALADYRDGKLTSAQ